MNRPLSLSLSFYIYGVVFRRVCVFRLYFSSVYYYLFFLSFFSVYAVCRCSFVRLRCGKIFINGFIIVSLRVDINWHWPQWIRQALACSHSIVLLLLLLLLFLYFEIRIKKVCDVCIVSNIVHVFFTISSRFVSFDCERREFGYRFEVDSKSIWKLL